MNLVHRECEPSASVRPRKRLKWSDTHVEKLIEVGIPCMQREGEAACLEWGRPPELSALPGGPAHLPALCPPISAPLHTALRSDTYLPSKLLVHWADKKIY